MAYMFKEAMYAMLSEMEAEAGEKMRFGGVGSELKGDFKDMEDKKHRAVYETLRDSDEKLYYFSARQIACRFLGSKGVSVPGVLATDGRLYVHKACCLQSVEGNEILAIYASKGLCAYEILRTVLSPGTFLLKHMCFPMYQI